MKAVILVGGLGTRVSEETDTKPKHMVEIGGKPILWNIMKGSMPLWGMGSKRSQATTAREFELVETMEDHLVDGGFGSWLMEADVTMRLRAHALSATVCGTVGSQDMPNALGWLGDPLPKTGPSGPTLNDNSR
jgi:Nucleotidyl transferase